MREIKFRAWDKKTKKMRQVTEIVFNTGFYLETNDNSVKLIWVKGQDIIENKEIQIQRQDDFELMQYTGLKDKNGKEIYEGDIIEIKSNPMNMTGIAIWDEYDLAFEIKDIDDDTQECMWYQEQELEILGNIYENPELLKEN